MVERQSTNIALLNNEYRAAKLELEQLRRNALENAARNPILCDELQVRGCVSPPASPAPLSSSNSPSLSSTSGPAVAGEAEIPGGCRCQESA